MSSPNVKIYLVRHAETNQNKDGIIQGHLNTALNDEGRRQAKLVAEVLKDVPLTFTFTFTSNLDRAKATAEVILKYHLSVEVTEQEELRERFQADHRGKKYGAEEYGSRDQGRL